MLLSNKDKVKNMVYRIAFLMQHQDIHPYLKEIVDEIYPEFSIDNNPYGRTSNEYLLGAHDALSLLLQFLEEKNPNQDE